MEIRLDPSDLPVTPREAIANEELCQALWKRYYAAVNISRRNNPKQHLRQLPRRYWPHLTEKQHQ